MIFDDTPADQRRRVLYETLVDTVDFHHFEGTAVTVCCLSLYSDISIHIVAHSATWDPQVFDAEKGKVIALRNALDRLNEFEGYRQAMQGHN